jgi:predicted dehydrogenase
MKRYKAILIGNGTMGKRHRERFERCGVEFVTVLDKCPEGPVLKCVDVSALADAVEGMQFDFAVVATSATSHYGYTKFLLERKIPVLVEKPLATDGAEAQELVELSERNGTLLFVAQSECFNPLFLNFRRHFLAELDRMLAVGGSSQGDVAVDGPAGKIPAVRLEFRREHRYSPRCRDVNVALDLLVHDLGLFFTMFKSEDVDVTLKTSEESCDRARFYLKVARGPYKGVVADFYVNRDSDVDVRTITVNLGRGNGSPESSYTVSLARYDREGEIEHVPDSLENEHRFFLKLLDGVCGDWGRRLAKTAAIAVRFATAP